MGDYVGVGALLDRWAARSGLRLRRERQILSEGGRSCKALRFCQRLFLIMPSGLLTLPRGRRVRLNTVMWGLSISCLG